MAMTENDRRLLKRCLDREPDAWNEFVDRFLGVVFHVVHHSAHMRSVPLQTAEVEDLAADVMLKLVENDLRILRAFRGKSSLATYIAVIARRVAVNKLAKRQAIERMRAKKTATESVPPELRIDTEDEVQQLLESLRGREAEIVRGYYLENKSYEELSEELGIPANSVGPTLSRLRARLRNAASN